VSKLVTQVPGVSTVSETGFGEAKFDGSSTQFSSIDPSTVEKVLNLELTSGSVKNLDATGVLVATKVAKSHGWKVGDAVPAEFAATGKKQLHVAGTFDGNGFLNGDYLLSLAAQEANATDRLDSADLVVLDKGANRGAVQKAIASVLAHHPDAKVLNQKQYRQEVGGMIDSLLTFVSIMLLLAVVIALLGIVNTLALSVFERTRELGLLRAVGMTSSQVRAMVRWESVVISLLGALVGAGLGIGLGLALSQSLKGQGITQVAVPSTQVLLYVLAAAVAGIVAAIGPARSAARVDVLKAVVSD
jgi:putative ABC transport system permease protein